MIKNQEKHQSIGNILFREWQTDFFNLTKFKLFLSANLHPPPIFPDGWPKKLVGIKFTLILTPSKCSLLLNVWKGRQCIEYITVSRFSFVLCWKYSEAYLGHCQTTVMDIFAKKPLLSQKLSSQMFDRVLNMLLVFLIASKKSTNQTRVEVHIKQRTKSYNQYT